MSAPIRSEDGPGDPLSYAPRWARQSPRVEPELSTFAHAPPTAPPKSAIADFDARAVELGSGEASRRLERLASSRRAQQP